MNAPTDLRARPSADDVAAIVKKLAEDFAERAVTSSAVGIAASNRPGQKSRPVFLTERKFGKSDFKGCRFWQFSKTVWHIL